MSNVTYAASARLLDHSADLTLQEAVANVSSSLAQASWGHREGSVKLTQCTPSVNVTVTQKRQKGFRASCKCSKVCPESCHVLSIEKLRRAKSIHGFVDVQAMRLHTHRGTVKLVGATQGHCEAS